LIIGRFLLRVLIFLMLSNDFVEPNKLNMMFLAFQNGIS
jgi:hypothetical protein